MDKAKSKFTFYRFPRKLDLVISIRYSYFANRYLTETHFHPLCTVFMITNRNLLTPECGLKNALF